MGRRFSARHFLGILFEGLAYSTPARNAIVGLGGAPLLRGLRIMPTSEPDRRRAFLEAVNAICRAAGGVLIEDSNPNLWEIDTPAGKLNICPMTDSEAPWIACRFLEPSRVFAKVEGADFLSGQWNFHLWSEWSRTANPQWEPALSNGMEYFETVLNNIVAKRIERPPEQDERDDRTAP
jgi:hypothetical protein